jgi:hypothetical protein
MYLENLATTSECPLNFPATLTMNKIGDDWQVIASITGPDSEIFRIEYVKHKFID